LATTFSFGISQAQANNDQAGAIGTVESIHLRSSSAKSSPFWNYVNVAGETYYWGGSVCPGTKLVYQGMSDTMVDALAEYATYPDMCIEPFYKNGQGGNRCLVSFTASLKTEANCTQRPR
jgi:hypothetical protein